MTTFSQCSLSLSLTHTDGIHHGIHEFLMNNYELPNKPLICKSMEGVEPKIIKKKSKEKKLQQVTERLDWWSWKSCLWQGSFN